MATDDQQILVTGTAPAPATWLVPGNGQVTPRTVFAHYDGTSAGGPFYPALKVISDGGQTVGIYPCLTAVAAGGSADVSWFPDVDVIQPAAQPTPGVTSETLFVPASASTGTLSTTTLTSGVTYTLVVEGDYTQVNEPLTQGTPNADAMFPTSVVGRVSTQVGIDAETVYAVAAEFQPVFGHTSNLRMSLDGGVTYAHIEPVGGPYFTPNAGRLYSYSVVGKGQKIGFQIHDTVYNDNYGQLKVTIQVPDGTGTGSGAGSLVPATSSTNNGQILATLSGIPAWSAVDGGTA